MTNILFLILIGLVIFDFISSFKRQEYFRKTIEAQQIITRMAKARSRLIELVELKQIDPNSLYFRYIYALSSHTIRALYKYGLSCKALENVDIIRASLKFYDKKVLKEEFKNLTYEQKRLFCNVSYDVLIFYLDSNYLLKLITKFTYTKVSSKIKSYIKTVLRSLLPEIEENINDAKLLKQYSSCDLVGCNAY